MFRNSRFLIWAVFILLGLLVILSVIGTFYGAERSKELFNSPFLWLFWIALTILFVLALFRTGRLRQNPGLLLMHLACVLVLIGSMWGSNFSHWVRSDYLNTSKVPGGYMTIYEGKSQKFIMSHYIRDKMAQLPFSIYLRDFRMDYYWDDGKLLIRSPKGHFHVMYAIPGHTIMPGEGLSSLKIVRVIKNLKVVTRDDVRSVEDDPGFGSNPALEVELTRENGKRERHYVFLRFPDRNMFSGGWVMHYRLGIKDFFSDLDVFQGGRVVDHKVIQVNDPLHYGGYYFYQASYDASQGQYSVLSVTSDSGYWLVFAGYFILCLGVFWYFWIQPFFRKAVWRLRNGD